MRLRFWQPDPRWAEMEESFHAIHEALATLADQYRDLQATVKQRSLLQHRHGLDDLEEHYHDIPGEHFEHKHEYEAVHQVATPKGPRLEGTVECEGCHARYDVQADCHIGDSRDILITCTTCNKQMRIGTSG